MLRQIKKKILAKWIKNRKRGKETGQISYEEAMQMMKKEKEVYLIDVRSSGEYTEGHLNRSINIPLYELSTKIGSYVKQKDTNIILYCSSGSRSQKGKEILNKMGYTNIYEIQGGLEGIEK